MKKFIDSYLDDLGNLMDLLETDNIAKAIEMLKEAHKAKRKVFVLGNGGSAATANHFVCDLGKNAIKDDENRFKIISLSDNICSITAYGNDISYDSVFAEQLKNLIEHKDLLICVSASGNSPNVLKAVEYARKKEAAIIGITGFDGGKLKELSDININVCSSSYEKVEDMHLIIMHIFVYWFKQNQGYD